MGFLDSVKGLFAPQRSLTAAPAAAVPPTEAEGVPGGGNFGGRVVGFEYAEELRDVAGYGRAGTYEVGEWALMALSNPYVTMGLDHLLRPVADARVDVEPPPESVIGTGRGRISQADADAMTAFVKWMVSEHYQLGPLNRVAAHGALLSGFSLFEPLAEEVDCPAVSRPVWALKAAVQCLPNSLDPSQPWRVDAQGRLVGIGQQGPVGERGEWRRTVLPADRALLFSWKREAGNFAGISQLRSVWYVGGRVMPRLLKIIGVTLQKEGPGWPQAVADKDAKELTPNQREELIKLYANMVAHEAAGMVMPKGWKTEWSFSPVSNKGHILAIVEKMGLWILQQFGAQQLVLGTNGEGNRSVGETHDARSMAMVREVLSFLAGVYNGARGEADGLIKRFVIYNWGPQPAYPKVKLTPQRPELAPKDLADASASAKGAGLLTPTLKDENSMRERLGFAPITQDELDQAREEAAARAPQLHPEPDDDEKGGPKDGDQDDEKPGKKPMRFSAPRVWAPSRPLRASEQKLKLNELDAFFASRRDAGEKIIRSEVVGMLGMAAPALERAMSDGKLTPAEVAALPLDTTRLAAALARFNADTRKAGGSFVRGELERGAIHAEQQDDKGAEAVADADEVVEATNQAQLKRIVNRVRADVEREAIDTMRTGGTAQEVVTRTIARQLDTGAFKADAGSVTTKVFNVGREEAARLMGGVAEVEYSAILDSATCSPCQAMDGRTADFGSAEHDAMTPPNRDCEGGDNCRCLLVYVPEKGGGDE